MSSPANRLPTKTFEVVDGEAERDDHVYYEMAGRKRKAHGTWYRGEHTNYHPMRASLAEPDAIDRYIGEGWFPAAPFISRQDYVTAFGSCFAAEITKYLLVHGYRVFGGDLSLNAHVIRSGEGIVNTHALRQQFDWAFEDRAPAAEVWHRTDGSLAEASAEQRDAARRIFLSTEVFIFTLGLSEVWFDKVTGDVFWRAIPVQSFDPERHGFRVVGAEENRANLTSVVDTIRRHRPQARIIFTLSPIPLAATFRPVSCMTANAGSKASLRVAIDELMREREDDRLIHYFPSYEIVTAFLPDALGDDLRHPRPETVGFVMETFRRRYLLP